MFCETTKGRRRIQKKAGTLEHLTGIVRRGCTGGISRRTPCNKHHFVRPSRRLSVSIVVVQHLDPSHPSKMSEILAWHTTLRVNEAREGERLQRSRVYVAKPDRHLLVNPDRTLSLSFTELVHFVRPSADLLLESVAMAYKDRAIAVVLSGTGKDGSNGVQSIDKMHGIVIAQESGRVSGHA